MSTAADAAEVLRISQRASTTCSECSRRKTRCDKQVPCDQCVKRGKAEFCRRVPHVRPKDAEKIRQAIASTPLPPPVRLDNYVQPSLGLPAAVYSQSSTSPDHQARHPTPLPTMDSLAFGAYSEIAEIRTAIGNLQDRLQGLEGILAGVFGPAKQETTSPALSMACPPQTSESWFAGFPADLAVSSAPAEQNVPHPPLQPAGLAGPAYSPDRPESHLAYTPTDQTLALPPLQAVPTSPPTTTMRHSRPPPTSSSITSHGLIVGAGAGDDPRWAKLREEEVAASLSLEFLALGRNQQGPTAKSADSAGKGMAVSIGDIDNLVKHPLSIYPDAASLGPIVPPFSDCERIVEYTLARTSWLHACVHAPTFRAEVQQFWAMPHDTRLREANPAWLSLFFAQICCGLRHSTRAQLDQLGPHGLSDQEVQILSKAHFDAAVACLYRSHPFENRQLHAVQAIAVLIIGCQDGALSNVFPSLLSLGIAMAQDLGLHRLPSDASWANSVAVLTPEERQQSLVLFETKKRIFWALTSEDWFSIHHRRMSTVQPTQVTTPLPSNAHDEDLMTGILIDRPPAEYTVTSKLLIWIQIARILQQAFEHLDDHPQPSYSFILELDSRMQGLLDRMPQWLTSSSATLSPASNLPPNAAWVRNAFVISSNHKILVLHRSFFLRHETSRRRAIDASRRILREAAHCGDTRMWTVPYHISAAASVICLDLFQRSSPSATLAEERAEVEVGLKTLQLMSSFSSIAKRGAALVQNLLQEEARLPPMAEERPGKRRRISAISAPTDAPQRSPTNGLLFGASSEQSPPGRSSGFLPTVLAAPSPAGQLGSPPLLAPFAGTSAGSPPHETSHRSPSDTLTDPLPAEFIAAFLESGFDPLDGAITATQQEQSWPFLFPST